MKTRSWLVIILLSVSALAAQTNTALSLPPGVQLIHEQRAQPSQEIFIVNVDLKKPGLTICVAPGGPDPDGPGVYQTTLMTVRAIAERDDLDVAVNGDFFSAKQHVDAKGKKSGYLTGLWAKVAGAAMSDGKMWGGEKEPSLWITRAGRAGISREGRAPPDGRQMISGHPLLVADGKAVPSESKAVHPRTAVGVDAAGARLVLLVVDGRHPEVATGMTYAEVAGELLRLGCSSGLNLDGGGSTTLVIRDAATGRRRVLNTPSGGHERPVANVLGVRSRPPPP